MKAIQRRQNKIFSISQGPKQNLPRKANRPSGKKYTTLISSQGKEKFKNFSTPKNTSHDNS
jgi:hypothetical protein